MQTFLNYIFKRKVSTERIDNMPSNAAVSALDHRVRHMLAKQAQQSLPQPNCFSPLSNLIQKPLEV